MELNENVEENIRFESRIDLSELRNTMDAVRGELQKVIVGQDKLIDYLLVALLANGHVLLEGVPGIAKTLAVKLLAKAVDTSFSRIQFTPDLMPSDILGTSVFDMKTSDFQFRKGPVFANLILVDEVNRAPAKTQAAMFEVMEERQITLDGDTYRMEAPFIVIATQNPIEQEGTYRLPEAQLDRFLFKIVVDYPNLAEEFEIIRREHETKGFNKKSRIISNVMSGDQVVKFQLLEREVIVKVTLMAYIANIVQTNTPDTLLYLGASPRASLAILNAAKGMAAPQWT
jgi:MoxR-like ATPase